MSLDLEMVDRKEHILEHASQSFFEMGVRNVTMGSLASSLGISKRTLYEYFEDKDQLVIEAIRYIIIENNKMLLQIIENSDNVVEAMYQISKHQDQFQKQFPKVFMEDIKRYFPMVHASFYACQADIRKLSPSYTLLEKGINQGIFRKEMRVDLVDRFLHEIISIIHNSDRIRLLNPTNDEVKNSIIIPYFRGVCTSKGLALMEKYFQNHNSNNS